MCPNCGQPSTVQRVTLKEMQPSIGHIYGVRIGCDRCDMPSFSSLHGLAFDSPEVRRFWRTYPRIRTLPERQIVVGGRNALLTRIENVAGTAGIDVLFARDSFEMISIHGASNG